MKKYFNTYTVPYKRRDKGYRACYKYWEHYSLIHDMSYFDYFIVKVDNKNNFLNYLLNNFCISENEENYQKEFVLFELKIYNNNGRLIGQIEFYSYQNIIIILCLAIITDEVYELLTQIQNI